MSMSRRKGEATPYAPHKTQTRLNAIPLFAPHPIWTTVARPFMVNASHIIHRDPSRDVLATHWLIQPRLRHWQLPPSAHHSFLHSFVWAREIEESIYRQSLVRNCKPEDSLTPGMPYTRYQRFTSADISMFVRLVVNVRVTRHVNKICRSYRKLIATVDYRCQLREKLIIKIGKLFIFDFFM